MRLTIFTLLLAFSCTVTKAQDSTKVLTEGTIVRLAIEQDISSKTAKAGDLVEFVTAEPVIVGDRVYVAKGVAATGIVNEVERPKNMGQPGKLVIDIKYLKLPSGKNVKLDGESNKSGKAATKGGMALGGMWKKGKDVEIKKGELFTVFVASDTVIQ